MGSLKSRQRWPPPNQTANAYALREGSSRLQVDGLRSAHPGCSQLCAAYTLSFSCDPDLTSSWVGSVLARYLQPQVSSQKERVEITAK